MKEDKFWDIVNEIDWRNDKHYKETRKRLVAKYSLEEMKEMRIVYKGLYDKLKDFAKRDKRNEKEKGINYGVGDDSFWDLLAHVIGLGKSHYYRVLQDRDLLMERAKARKFAENFSYCIPREDDYKNKETVNNEPTNATPEDRDKEMKDKADKIKAEAAAKAKKQDKWKYLVGLIFLIIYSPFILAGFLVRLGIGMFGDVGFSLAQDMAAWIKSTTGKKS